MNYLIPMLGLGTRFVEYEQRKPFIRAHGTTIIERVVKPLTMTGNTVYIAVHHSDKERIVKLFGDQVEVITMNRTKGAAETIYNALQFIPNCQPFTCVDCDTIISGQLEDKIGGSKLNRIFTFTDEKRTGIYSYLETDGAYNVLDIVEKDAISTTANSGIYQFRDAHGYLKAYKDIEDKGQEVYTSHVIKRILQNEDFLHEPVDGLFYCVGTPGQLQEFCDRINTKKTVCVDMDGTILYDLVNDPKPIERNVEYLRTLHDQGHEIVIHTARGMLSTGSKEAAEEKYVAKVYKTLHKLNIPYDRLEFGKPYADIYIDDKAISAYDNLERAIGIYGPSKMIQPREQNSIKIVQGKIHKRGAIQNEAYYYNNIPNEVKQWYPKIHQADQDCIVMDKVNGPTFSDLLLLHKIEKADIDQLVKTIKKLHGQKPGQSKPVKWYYNDKLVNRFEANKTLYECFSLVNLVTEQAKAKYPNEAYQIIHGDPVFTNVFKTRNGISFIDPRGADGNGPTIYGPPSYDYAKVLQSLFGYDFALRNEPIPENYLRELREHFYDQVSYTADQLNGMVLSLLLSLLPLHQDDDARLKRLVKLIYQNK